VSKPLPAGGVYNITVVDLNNCSTETSITVAEVPKPVYTVTKTDINCYGVASGEIQLVLMVTVCDTALITERLTAQTQLFQTFRNLYSRIGIP
jgi:hypothetical protein